MRGVFILKAPGSRGPGICQRQMLLTRCRTTRLHRCSLSLSTVCLTRSSLMQYHEHLLGCLVGGGVREEFIDNQQMTESWTNDRKNKPLSGNTASGHARPSIRQRVLFPTLRLALWQALTNTGRLRQRRMSEILGPCRSLEKARPVGRVSEVSSPFGGGGGGESFFGSG